MKDDNKPKIIFDKDQDLLTEGERYALDRKLKILLANDDCFIYIQPHSNVYRPDIVLVSKKYGIAIIEVKEWDEEFIKSTQPAYIETIQGRHKNPNKHIDVYENIIISNLSNIFSFVDVEGNLKFNIKKYIF